MIRLWLMACEEDVTEIPVTCNDSLTYANVGEPFMRNYCTGCHATKLPAGQRYGAPESVQLDTFAGAKQWAIRSYVRAVHFQDMPPSGGISDIERERFKQWALCGAKGEPTDTPTVEVQDRTTSRTILSMSIEGPEDSVQLQRFIKDDSLIDPDGLLMRDEFYRVDGVRAEFVGYDEWDRDGMMISSVRFEPALPMTPEEWVEELTVTAIIEMDGSAWEETQNWTGEQQYLSLWDLDVHERDPNPLHTRWWNEQGEEWGWRMSSDNILSSAYGTTIQALQWEAMQFSGPDSIMTDAPFPLDVDDGWVDLWIEREL